MAYSCLIPSNKTGLIDYICLRLSLKPKSENS
jgi:hypothetical protein